VVRPRNTALIASRVLAPIVDVAVKAGDRVRRNGVLVTLDTRGSEAGRTGAHAAALAAAESARAAEADVRAAESAVTLARATHERIAGLHAKRSATSQELDQAVAALAAAEAQRTGAQARLAAATAAGEAASAAAESAAIAAGYGVLRSPFDGIVTERRADPGSMAAPGMTLLVVEDPRAYRLEVAVDESRIAQLRSGDTVDVRLDTAVAESAWQPARIAEIDRIDPGSHSSVVKIELGESPGLRSGRFGRARFPGAPRRTLIVPAAAIVRRGQLAFVFLAADDGRAHLRPIAAGVAANGAVEVRAGARAGDRVVVAPPPALADGARVSESRP
jgi:multidrug efflux pump subunit AcrA (membrane-fusion protein)